MPSAIRQPHQLNTAVKLRATVRCARLKRLFLASSRLAVGVRERSVRVGGGHGLRAGRIGEHRRCSEGDGLAWTGRQAGH